MELPAKYVRNDSFYRSAPGPWALAVSAAGFAYKPTPRGSYRHRVLKNYVMVYCLRGTASYTDWQNRKYTIEAGCAIQMPADRRHSVLHKPDGQWTECWFVLNGDFSRALMGVGVIDEARPVLRPGVDFDIVEQFERLLHEMKHGPQSALPEVATLVTDLLVRMHSRDHHSPPARARDALIEKACRTLSRDLDRRIHTADLLEGSDLSYERFRKIFREQIGLSPGEYRIRRRIDRARAMLSEGKLSMKQVAYALGYRDPFTFSKQFKQVVGFAPAAFREMV